MKKLILLLTLLVFVTGKIFAQQVIPAYRNPKRLLKDTLEKTIQKNSIMGQTINASKKKPDSLKKLLLSHQIYIPMIFNMSASKVRNSSDIFLLDSVKKILSDNPDVQNAVDLKILKDSLRLTNDNKKLASLDSQINNIKIYNTEQFLSHLKPTKPYNILDIGSYQVDSLNKYFYNQSNVSALQTGNIQNFTGSTTFISTELASFLFGPVRMGIGGTFTSKGDSTQDNAIKTSLQKIVSNGGTIDFNFFLPLFFARSSNEQSHFGISFQMNNGINPGIDTTGSTNFSKNLSYTNQSGIVFHYDVGSNDGKALLSFDVPCYYVSFFGDNNLYKIAGVSNFAMVKLQVGAVFNNLLSLHLSGPLLSSSKTVLNTPWAISLQFSPGQILKTNSN
jgi:hypothetical protein